MENLKHAQVHIATTNGVTKKCVKCSDESVQRSGTMMEYCGGCFLIMIKSKFRSAVTKERVFKGRDRRVMVLLDGSKKAAFLFRQVEETVKQDSFKPLMMEPCSK
ncbi:hypothetical protein RB195_022426 [Necator americanus]|uniref:Cytoplasmic tRNA 2-thiolation protein 2 n=1 Tax=Necator americanus TaxID=51031 RepID=A0ABR1EF92_NECAM